MNHRTRIAAAVAAAVSPLALAVPGAHAAPDHGHYVVMPTPGCISTDEWRTLHLNPAVSRDEMERRFHVHHARDRWNITPKGERHRFFVYRACGYSLDDMQIEVTLERDNRPGFDRSKGIGERAIVGGLWWHLADGDCLVCPGQAHEEVVGRARQLAR